MAKKSLLKKPTQKTTKKVVTRPKATAKTDLIVEPEIQEERIVFDDLEGKMLHIKVGTDDNIAGVEHINDVRDDITRLINEHNGYFLFPTR